MEGLCEGKQERKHIQVKLFFKTKKATEGIEAQHHKACVQVPSKTGRTRVVRMAIGETTS